MVGPVTIGLPYAECIWEDCADNVCIECSKCVKVDVMGLENISDGGYGVEAGSCSAVIFGGGAVEEWSEEFMCGDSVGSGGANECCQGLLKFGAYVGNGRLPTVEESVGHVIFVGHAGAGGV